MGLYMDTKEKKNGLKDSERKWDSQFYSRGLGALVYHQGALAQPLNLFSAKGRDKPVVKHLPAVTSKTSLRSQQF
jgi:hypothetical protein